MRTTLDLPDDLIEKAVKISHSKTKTEAVTLALIEMIKRNEMKELSTYSGKIDLKIDLDELRKRK